MTADEMPDPPEGYAACRTMGGRMALFGDLGNEQTTHFVKLNERGRHSGPTVCGLTRFDTRNAEGLVTRPADIPGWAMNGGVSGPEVIQTVCPDCVPAVEAIDRGVR
jgi:hypothetical protein